MIKNVFKNVRSILLDSALYNVIKKIVLVIFRIIYDISKQLPLFLFNMVIFIIVFVAVFAQHLDEESIEESIEIFKPIETLENNKESNKNKSSNLLDYNKNDSDESYFPEYVEVIPVEEKIAYEAISSNIVNFYKNSLLELHPDAEVLVVHTGMAADLAKNIQTKTTELVAGFLDEYKNEELKHRFSFDISDSPSDIEHVKSMFERSGSISSSEDMDRIVGMIRSGSQLTILTPSSSSFSTATPEIDPNNSPVTPKEMVVEQPSKPAVIILTKKVEEGEPIPPLPSRVKNEDITERMENENQDGKLPPVDVEIKTAAIEYRVNKDDSLEDHKN